VRSDHLGGTAFKTSRTLLYLRKLSFRFSRGVARSRPSFAASISIDDRRHGVASSQWTSRVPACRACRGGDDQCPARLICMGPATSSLRALCGGKGSSYSIRSAAAFQSRDQRDNEVARRFSTCRCEISRNPRTQRCVVARFPISRAGSSALASDLVDRTEREQMRDQSRKCAVAHFKTRLPCKVGRPGRWSNAEAE
jgi:hypothetical protein